MRKMLFGLMALAICHAAGGPDETAQTAAIPDTPQPSQAPLDAASTQALETNGGTFSASGDTPSDILPGNGTAAPMGTGTHTAPDGGSNQAAG